MSDQINEQSQAYEFKKKALLQKLQQSTGQLTLKKKTASNLFRYIQPAEESAQQRIEVTHFDNIIAIDAEQGVLDVEGMTPYEKIVEYTLQLGWLPTVVPELKHITVGGAMVGIGIESSGHKYGFVHDGLLEADVLLPEGRVVTARPNNEFADLFYALPNSYGTLGYILRAKIKLYPVKTYVHMQIERFTNEKLFLDAMLAVAKNAHIDFVEGLIFSKKELYLMVSCFAPAIGKTDDIYREHIFYQLVREKQHIKLSTYDYIFRYDPDWFWNIPETFFYQCFRKLAPKTWRNSGFYKKYVDSKKRWFKKLGFSQTTQGKQEPLIQDWEVRWENSSQLLSYALEHIDLEGKPWAVIPIKPIHAATLYPLEPGTMYFNLGCYCYSKTQAKTGRFYNTKLMDDFCFSLGGLKMLYSSTFLSEEVFSKLYNGSAYRRLKAKYDPKNVFKNLYEKISS